MGNSKAKGGLQGFGHPLDALGGRWGGEEKEIKLQSQPDPVEWFTVKRSLTKHGKKNPISFVLGQVGRLLSW